MDQFNQNHFGFPGTQFHPGMVESQQVGYNLGQASFVNSAPTQIHPNQMIVPQYLGRQSQGQAPAAYLVPSQIHQNQMVASQYIGHQNQGQAPLAHPRPTQYHQNQMVAPRYIGHLNQGQTSAAESVSTRIHQNQMVAPRYIGHQNQGQASFIHPVPAQIHQNQMVASQYIGHQNQAQAYITRPAPAQLHPVQFQPGQFQPVQSVPSQYIEYQRQGLGQGQGQGQAFVVPAQLHQSQFQSTQFSPGQGTASQQVNSKELGQAYQQAFDILYSPRSASMNATDINSQRKPSPNQRYTRKEEDLTPQMREYRLWKSKMETLKQAKVQESKSSQAKQQPSPSYSTAPIAHQGPTPIEINITNNAGSSSHPPLSTVPVRLCPTNVHVSINNSQIIDLTGEEVSYSTPAAALMATPILPSVNQLPTPPTTASPSSKRKATIRAEGTTPTKKPKTAPKKTSKSPSPAKVSDPISSGTKHALNTFMGLAGCKMKSWMVGTKEQEQERISSRCNYSPPATKTVISLLNDQQSPKKRKAKFTPTPVTVQTAIVYRAEGSGTTTTTTTNTTAPKKRGRPRKQPNINIDVAPVELVQAKTSKKTGHTRRPSKNAAAIAEQARLDAELEADLEAALYATDEDTTTDVIESIEVYQDLEQPHRLSETELNFDFEDEENELATPLGGATAEPEEELDELTAALEAALTGQEEKEEQIGIEGSTPALVMDSSGLVLGQDGFHGDEDGLWSEDES